MRRKRAESEDEEPRPGTSVLARPGVVGWRSSARCVVVSAAVVGLGVAVCSEARAAICDAAAFSCPATGTCVINNTWLVGDGCTLDFGDMTVELKGTLQAETMGGSFEVRARELTLTAGKMRSLGDADETGGEITVEVAELFGMRGTGPRLDVAGNGGGGTIDVTAGQITLESGTISANGGSGESCGDAGLVRLAARSGSMVVGAALSSSTPGHDCYGGVIDLSAPSITISSDVDARGGAEAAPDAIVAVAFAGNLVVTGSAGLKADGTGQPDGFGANGGAIILVADGGDVSVAASPLTVTGKSPDGTGGELFVQATGDVMLSANASASGGSAGFGGEMAVTAGGRIDVTGNLTATGGMSFPAGEGGTVSLRAGGEALVTSTIDVTGATGGDITIDDGHPVTVTGTLRARGARGTGGLIVAAGCAVAVSGTLDANSTNGGDAGAVDLIGATLSLGAGASMTASPCTGSQCTTLTTAGSPPSVAYGVTISPAPAIFVDPSLPPC